jgi:hypothetical protein
MKDEVLKLALEALELHLAHHEHGCVYLDPAVTAIQEALAQPAQKRPQNCGTGYCSCIECVMEPPQRTWADLTNEQRINISYKADGNECVAVELTEAKLKELNHG